MISLKEKYIITLLFFFCISFSTYILTDIINQKNIHESIITRVKRLEDRIDNIQSSRWTYDDHLEYEKKQNLKSSQWQEILQDFNKRLDQIKLKLNKK